MSTDTLILDCPAQAYVRENPRISYVEPDDPLLRRQLTASMEVCFGRRRIEAIYHALKNRPFDIHTFFDAALQATNITPVYDAAPLSAIPKQGPLVMVANHPFGVLDGLVMCQLALQIRGNFRIMIHSLLCQDQDLAPYLLPIDFRQTKAATRNNIAVKKAALQALEHDIPVLIFPSGMVSTANKFGFGEVKDAPWTTFAAKLIRAAEATAVPIHFFGQNSRKFHVASHIAEPMRMALLVHEVLRKQGEQVHLNIGAPIDWGVLRQFESRQSLTHYLYNQVQALGHLPSAPPEMDSYSATTQG